MHVCQVGLIMNDTDWYSCTFPQEKDWFLRHEEKLHLTDLSLEADGNGPWTEAALWAAEWENGSAFYLSIKVKDSVVMDVIESVPR